MARWTWTLRRAPDRGRPRPLPRLCYAPRRRRRNLADQRAAVARTAVDSTLWCPPRLRGLRRFSRFRLVASFWLGTTLRGPVLTDRLGAPTAPAMVSAPSTVSRQLSPESPCGPPGANSVSTVPALWEPPAGPSAEFIWRTDITRIGDAGGYAERRVSIVVVSRCSHCSCLLRWPLRKISRRGRTSRSR
jgi:hypothetical protein